MAGEAVFCHVDEDEPPRVIRLHLVCEEGRRMTLPPDRSGEEFARLWDGTTATGRAEPVGAS